MSEGIGMHTRTYYKDRNNRRNRSGYSEDHDSKYVKNGPLSPLRSPMRSHRDDFKRRGSRKERMNRTEPFKTSLENSKDFPPLSEQTQVGDWFKGSQPLKGIACAFRDEINLESKERTSSEETTIWHNRASSFSKDEIDSRIEMEEKIIKRTTPDQPKSFGRHLGDQDVDTGTELTDNPQRYRRRLEMEPNNDNENDKEWETDEVVLSRRQKQLVYGKSTPGYTRYTSMVQMNRRQRKHPWTPNKYQKCSRRSFDEQVRIWRRNLHEWDPPSGSKRNHDGVRVEDSTETSMDTCDTPSVMQVMIHNNDDAMNDSPARDVHVEELTCIKPISAQTAMPDVGLTDDFELDLCLQDENIDSW